MKKIFSKSFSIPYFIIVIIFISAIIDLYEKRGKFKSFIKSKVQKKEISSKQETLPSVRGDNYWAKEIMNGGYILHFRHAERDKWVDVQMYDLLESDLHNNGKEESRYAENDYFANAVCLNKKGKIQAKAMGESLNHIGFPVGVVYSTPSCRARQTADLAFDGYDKLSRILLYGDSGGRGLFNEDVKDHVNKLKELYSNINIEKGKNAIISSHGDVLNCGMFINEDCPDYEGLRLGEGGFWIIRQSEKGLILEHKFYNFYKFMRIFYNR